MTEPWLTTQPEDKLLLTSLTLVIQILPKQMCMTLMRTLTISPVEDGLNYSVYMTSVQSSQVTTKIFQLKPLCDQLSLDDKKPIIEYNKKITTATKPPNIETMPHKPKKVSIHLQEEPSTPPCEEPSGESEEATNPDEPTLLTMVHK